MSTRNRTTIPSTTAAPAGESVDETTESVALPGATVSSAMLNAVPPAAPETVPVATESEYSPQIGTASNGLDVPFPTPPSPADLIAQAKAATEGTIFLRSTSPNQSSDGTMFDPYAKLYFYPGKATPTPLPLSSWMGLQLDAGLIAICTPDFNVRQVEPSSFHDTLDEELDEHEDERDDR